MQTLEATLDETGHIHFVDPIQISGIRRVLVTLLDAPETSAELETSLLSQPVLANDWLKPEEDAAWTHLQRVRSQLSPSHFSDLGAQKFRPAVLLAAAGRGDWVLCQITSNPYADAGAVEISQHDFCEGSLLTYQLRPPQQTFYRQ